jgi:hypothetical protein
MNEIADKDENLVKKGKMKKEPWDMSPEERRVWKKHMRDEIRSRLFSIGQPLVYYKNNRMIAEYPDGRIENV